MMNLLSKGLVMDNKHIIQNNMYYLCLAQCNIDQLLNVCSTIKILLSVFLFSMSVEIGVGLYLVHLTIE